MKTRKALTHYSAYTSIEVQKFKIHVAPSVASYALIRIKLAPCHLLLMQSSLYVPKIIKFYRRIQLLPAKMKVGTVDERS